ncbi:MAG: T9SS type A sorting domain-containing protein [Chitinophagales bacterium]
MKNLLLVVIIILAFFSSQAQQIHRCYTDEYVQYLNTKNPGIQENIRSVFDIAKSFQNTKASLAAEDTIFRIPVVVHIVYNTAQENLSDALINSQIDVLNKDFRRLNLDTANTRAVFKDRAADVGFEFHLATIDPQGNPTTGITRTNTTRTSFGGSFPSPSVVDEVKKANTEGIEAWNTDTYLNIWVCNIGGGLLGYAYPPEAAPNWSSTIVPNDKGLWGVVISHEVFGFDNPFANGSLSLADQGRTAVHEVGHFMGLRHIWGDAGSSTSPNCALFRDDGIDDTPHMGHNSQIAGCDTSINSCSNAEFPDEPDMFENYMDYSREACQNLFTQGQSNLMRNMAVIGRPDLARVLKDEEITLNIGEYIVINGTDTFQIVNPIAFIVNAGDEIMFLNMNNGYNYTVTEYGLYTSESQVFILTATGEAKLKVETSPIKNITKASFKIYPNPLQNILNIKSEQDFDQIKITSIEGKSVLTKTNINTSKIEIDGLTTGIYFVHIYSVNKLLGVQKITVLK